MRVGGAVLAVLVAALVQSAISLIIPKHSGLFDPFLILTVHYSLTRGEGVGMIVGTAAGWVQEVLFGGHVLGLLGLTRAILSYLVGQAGRRFLLNSAGAHLIVIAAASLLDGWLRVRLAALFDLPFRDTGYDTLLQRAVVNALVGAIAFGAVARIRPQEPGA
jgi:rod shape-determining protein MreD